MTLQQNDANLLFIWVPFHQTIQLIFLAKQESGSTSVIIVGIPFMYNHLFSPLRLVSAYFVICDVFSSRTHKTWTSHGHRHPNLQLLARVIIWYDSSLTTHRRTDMSHITNNPQKPLLLTVLSSRTHATVIQSLATKQSQPFLKYQNLNFCTRN